MTADVYQSILPLPPTHNLISTGKLRLGRVLTFFGYTTIFLLYASIFLLTFLTVGYLEMRQANIIDFNALIAILDQRDRDKKENYLDNAIKSLHEERNKYNSQIETFKCYKVGVKYQHATELVSANQNEGVQIPSTKPLTCTEIKQTLQGDVNALSLTEGELRFRSANLKVYYDQYEDGIAQKTPQIIPALRLLDDPPLQIVTVWARLPFELIEMSLLVLMGIVGGMINVMQYLIRPSWKKPSILECFLMPTIGAAISLGMYVLFRAAQLFLGVQSQNSVGGVSTSIFLLAGLGLASGFCASEALDQIKSLSASLLRSSGNGTSNGTSSDTGETAQQTREMAL